MVDYSKQNWVNGPNGNTPVNAARLNHMEDGIKAAVRKAAGVTDTTFWGVFPVGSEPTPPNDGKLHYGFVMSQGALIWDPVSGTWKPAGGGGGTDPDPDPDPVDPFPGQSSGGFGWLLTPSNTGLAAVGVAKSSLTLQTLPTYTGNGPNASGTYTRKKFVDQVVVPAAGTKFIECSFETSFDILFLGGTGIEFHNCDIDIINGEPAENVSITGHPSYAGEGASVLIKDCKLTGGTMFMNLTWMGGLVTGTYCYDQQPETGALQHRDGFTTRGMGSDNPVTIDGCRFDCAENSTTGALFVQDTYGEGISGLVVKNSMFEGAGNCITLESGKNMTFINNRTRSYGPYAVGDLTGNGQNTFTQWTDNYKWANSAPLYRGALLPQP